MRRHDDVRRLQQRARRTAPAGRRRSRRRRPCPTRARRRARRSSTSSPRAALTMPHAVAHLRDRVGVDRAARLVVQRQVQRQEVGAREHVVEASRSRRRARGSARPRRTGRTRRRCICRPSARRATCWPMRPKPSTPSVLSASSTPPHFERSQRPSTSAACACGMLRASASSRPIVCSAAETTFDSGAFATTMPRRVAASTSTLSTPTPARPITFRFVPRSISSAVSFVAERMTIAS